MRGSMASGSTHLAAAYLWDLRRPKKPASSLNFPVEPLSAASPAPAAAAAADCAGTVEAASVTSSPLTSRAVAASCVGEVGPAAGVPGILCLSVHEDGALAAGGFKDGRVLTWDMRQVRIPSSAGHVLLLGAWTGKSAMQAASKPINSCSPPLQSGYGLPTLNGLPFLACCVCAPCSLARRCQSARATPARSTMSASCHQQHLLLRGWAACRCC